MDSKNIDYGISPTYRLLALCARAESHPQMVDQLSRQVEAFRQWDELPAQAELHGMAPLLWHHIQQSQISIPTKTQQVLAALYLRHRVFNQAHTRTLLEITTLFEQAGIRALPLKGLALAYEYYPSPALRPASDIDFLLKRDEILPALDLLASAGYDVRSPRPTPSLLAKELSADSPLRDGIRTHVELHYYDPRLRTLNDNTADNEFIGFNEAAHAIEIEGQLIFVPAPMDTLDYLCRHLERHLFEATANKPLQLKWIADIISIVERHAESMDWDRLQKENQALLQRLEVFYSLTPIPDHLAKYIPVKQIEALSGFNQYPNGWPQQRILKWRRVGLIRFLWQTFTPPSVWWLRLYYGVNQQSCFWVGQVVHRMRIFNLLLHALIGRISAFISRS